MKNTIILILMISTATVLQGQFSFNNINVGDCEGCKNSFVVDLDSDGDLDIVSGGENKILWIKNEGSNTFSEISIELNGAGNFRYLFADDVDNDGDIDIVSASQQ